MTIKDVFIILDENDLNFFAGMNSPDTLVITDIPCGNMFNNVRVPSVMDEAGTVNDVKGWFYDESIKNDVNYGYVNNFYECSIRPILRFFDEIINVIDEEKGRVRFFLGRKPLLMVCTSTYYLAEYESMGVKLYDRRSTFLPYIVKLLESKRVTYHFSSYSFKVQALLGPVRRSIVLAYRFAKSLKCSLLNDHRQKVSKIKYDTCFVLRTEGQARVVVGFLNKTKLNTIVLIAQSGINDDVSKYLEENVNNSQVTIIRCAYPSPKEVTGMYLKQLLRKNYPAKYNIREIELNLSSACNEMSIMQIDLLLYRLQLESTLKECEFSENSKLISLEFTSPHAFIDSETAKVFRLVPIQVQPCDRQKRPLPHPVFSRLLCAKNTYEASQFSLCWPQHCNQIKYVGTFGEHNNEANIFENFSSELKVGIFTGVHEKVNRQLVDFLTQRYVNSKLDFLIKKHPRDALDYKSYNNVRLINKVNSSYFDLVITLPSAVISELVLLNIPFLIYVPQHHDYIVAANSDDDIYLRFLSCESLDELEDYFENIQATIENSQSKIEGYLEEKGFVFDVERIAYNIEHNLVLNEYE